MDNNKRERQSEDSDQQNKKTKIDDASVHYFLIQVFQFYNSNSDMFHVFTLGLHTYTKILKSRGTPPPPRLTPHPGKWPFGKMSGDLEKF